MQAVRPEVVGRILLQRGWRQGSLLDATSATKSWLVLSDHQETTQKEQGSSSTISQGIWILQQAPLDTSDVLIVASQTCDIQRSTEQEPYLEIIRGFWTSDRSIMHQARKNSSRLFLMQRRLRDDGKEQALIADATIHIQIEKAAFLTLTPQSSFKENDRITPYKFSEWLARRYNRSALPDAVVNAIQKPVVRAIDRLPATNDLHRILDGIDEILFLLRNDDLPFQVDMIFLRDERNDVPYVSAEDAAQLGGWLADILRRGNEAELMYWEMLSQKEISVYDYSNAFELPLDYYTSWNDGPEYQSGERDTGQHR